MARRRNKLIILAIILALVFYGPKSSAKTRIIQSCFLAIITSGLGVICDERKLIARVAYSKLVYSPAFSTYSPAKFSAKVPNTNQYIFNVLPSHSIVFANWGILSGIVAFAHELFCLWAKIDSPVVFEGIITKTIQDSQSLQFFFFIVTIQHDYRGTISAKLPANNSGVSNVLQSHRGSHAQCDLKQMLGVRNLKRLLTRKLFSTINIP